MTAARKTLDWCRSEAVRLKHSIVMFESGKIQFRSRGVGEDWVDESPKHIADCKQRLSEIETMIAQHEQGW